MLRGAAARPDAYDARVGRERRGGEARRRHNGSDPARSCGPVLFILNEDPQRRAVEILELPLAQ